MGPHSALRRQGQCVVIGVMVWLEGLSVKMYDSVTLKQMALEE